MIAAAARVAFLVAALATAGAHAESEYVIDRLFVGVHEEPTAESAIVQMLPTGAEVEVLEHDGELVRVRTADGIVGWVAQAYLTADKPARLTVVELQQQVETDTRELDRARQLIDELEREVRTGEARIGELEDGVDAARKAREEAEARTAAALAELEQVKAEAPAETPIPSDTLRQLQQLAEDNQRLKQQVAELEAVQAMVAEQQAAREAAAPAAAATPAPADEPTPAAGPVESRMPLPRLQDWQWLLLGSALLLAFGAGGWLVDLGVRRRHGGFRI